MQALSNSKHCDLCPRGCGIYRGEGERGACGAGAQMEVSRAALHMWEEPPISGEQGSGTIFFAHCPLGCVYCQNYAISGVGGVSGQKYSPEDVAQMCLDLEAQGALNINMVTPTHYAPLVRDAIQIARARGLALPIVWNTSGYETRSAIRDNAGLIDIYLTDFKYASSDLASKLSSAPDYPKVALDALDEMVLQVGCPTYDEYQGQSRMTSGVVVRHMILPGHLDDSIKIVKMLNERFGGDILLSLMNQYTPVLLSRVAQGDVFAARVLERCPELANAVSSDEYEQLLDYADSLGIDDYFWQQGGACKESFIPDWDL